jgi:hypothetical protein
LIKRLIENNISDGDEEEGGGEGEAEELVSPPLESMCGPDIHLGRSRSFGGSLRAASYDKWFRTHDHRPTYIRNKRYYPCYNTYTRTASYESPS